MDLASLLFIFFNSPKGDVQHISLARAVPAVSSGLRWGPATSRWLLAAKAEPFRAVQRAPSADFHPGSSHHRERPFQDLKNVVYFVN